MKSIIKEIYFGNRGGCDSVNLKNNEKWLKEMTTVDSCYDQIEKVLSPEHFAIFKSFETALQDAHAEETAAYYIEGFKFGLLTGIECAEDL